MLDNSVGRLVEHCTGITDVMGSNQALILQLPKLCITVMINHACLQVVCEIK